MKLTALLLLVLILSSCRNGVEQSLTQERNGSYTLATLVWRNSDIVWSHYVWYLDLAHLDSIRKQEYALAKGIDSVFAPIDIIQSK